MISRNKDAMAQGHDDGSMAGEGGAADGQCWCRSLRVRGWWMLTKNSHGMEISIAGGVEKMVRFPNPMPFFSSFFFFMCFVLFVI